MTRPAPATSEGRGARPAGARPPATRTADTRPAPWVRTRLRASLPATLLGAALAFVAVLLAAAVPRAVDRGADGALRSFLQEQGPVATSLLATTSSRNGPQTPQELDAALATLRARAAGAFRLAPSGPVYGARSLKSRALTTPGLDRPEGVDPLLSLVHLPQSASHTKLVAGRWPSGGEPGGPVPVALSRSASQTLNAPLGTVLDTPVSLAGPVRAEVVGLYDVTDPADVYWSDLLCLTKSCQTFTPDSKRYWQTAALVGADALDRLDGWGTAGEFFWRLPVDTGVLRADRLPDTAHEVASFVAGPTASDLALVVRRPDLRITSRLPELFERAEARRRGTAPLAAIGPVGVAGVGVVVFCLAAALLGDRREAELRLLRARGGSRCSVVLRLLTEGAAAVVPATALAALLAAWLLPTPRWGASLTAACAVGLVALSAFPARAFMLLSVRHGQRPRRRLVAESLVVTATAAAVFEVRRRGVSASAGVDPLLVAAPLLLALCGALALARLQPLALEALARAAGRGPGLVGFLGAARAARGTGGRPRPSVLPLVALLLAVTTGGFGATVLTSVDTARTQVARQAVGGDAQIAAPAGDALPQELLRSAGVLPGVRTAVPVRVEEDAFVFGLGRGSLQVTVVVADPVAYAGLARTVGRGRFDPAALATGAPGAAQSPAFDAPLPALFSGDLGAAPGGRAVRLRVRGEELQVRAAGVVTDGTPALPGRGSAVIVLPDRATAAAAPQAARPNRWFATGPVDADRLDELVRTGAPGADAVTGPYVARTSAALVAALSADPLQHSAVRLFWASVGGAAGFALLAVLLTLLRAAPERAALLARLRTMGLRPRQGVALILAETLPQALVAAVGGALVATAAVALLGPAVDLSSLVGSPVPAGLRLTAPPVLTQTLGLAALVAVAVLVEAALSGRRQITTELRAGDQR
ncbi:hypothetical protein AMK16_21315 [Streptomyces sp. CB00455]|uniref:FtsX-like permease family protein n=1 Tax=Streptomyces sp. CB00455 TaxID=1703927 RepID=UPI00093CD367|nr:hypothetical protein [Streptomyces sp. CB00455]OKK17387.1 hypothetical protein AMK16_21315 [Streptomyces sp. CB00455]